MQQTQIKIISGGQTGVDRAALDAAIELQLPMGGWCPKGRKAEDGIIEQNYSLVETPLEKYEQRTEWNVRDSDMTLILSWGEPKGGTKYTITMAEKFKKPLCIVDMQDPLPIEKIVAWIKSHNPRILNVAGPREDSQSTIYSPAKKFLLKLLKGIL
jgi:hypothetical protein